jgi:hypothetical protein
MNKELLLITVYCIVDDFLRQPRIRKLLIRPGPKPKLTDAEVLTLAFFQEFTSIKDEDEYWQYIENNYSSYFPNKLIDLSQYHRRKKGLSDLANQLRQCLVRQLTCDNYHIIDCTGTSVITVTKFRHQSTFENADVGYCASKDQRYAGYKTLTVISLNGVIEDFETGTARPHDVEYAKGLLQACDPGIYLGDKGFIMDETDSAALEQRGVRLITHKRKNMKQQLGRAAKWLLKRFRHITETINGHLTELFSFGKPGGKSERGVFSRLGFKLAAHTLGQYILRLQNKNILNLDWLVGA